LFKSPAAAPQESGQKAWYFIAPVVEFISSVKVLVVQRVVVKDGHSAEPTLPPDNQALLIE
jgi:hypothetical protein